MNECLAKLLLLSSLRIPYSLRNRLVGCGCHSYWYYRFYVEDESGKMVQREFAGTESKSETESLLRKAMEDYEAKKFVAKPENTIVGMQELLGHADVSTTMNIYAHSKREAKRTSARLLDKVVGET